MGMRMRRAHGNKGTTERSSDLELNTFLARDMCETGNGYVTGDHDGLVASLSV